jgi:hypothetical protein
VATETITTIIEKEPAAEREARDEFSPLFRELLATGLIALQIVLLALFMRELDILSSTFRRILVGTSVAFMVHHWMPTRYRLSFFMVASLGTVAFVLGLPPLAGTSWTPSLAVPRLGMFLAAAGLLIAICRLPFSYWVRVLLLVGVGAGAAAFRSEAVDAGIPGILWPILAAMFMFRIIVYLYDSSVSGKRPSWKESWAYFLMLPNVCFTLFPVVDFKTFVGSRYNEEALAIYNRGLQWMGRGVLQLIIYRFVDQAFAMGAADVASGRDLIQFITGNVLLYLSVSGQFHLIVGMLLLFGFNLPAANRNYFLASSFTDYWRRINIYWKDFMMKVFYYPIFFRFKHRGAVPALIISTFSVFFVTWLFHFYQTWWIKGGAWLTWPDVLFWSAFGMLVLANSYWEMVRVRRRAAPEERRQARWRGDLGVLIRTAGTFVAISLLWSLWSSDSVSTWLGLFRYADLDAAVWGMAVVGTVMAAKIVLELWPEYRREAGRTASPEFRIPVLPYLQLRSAVPLVLLFVLANPRAQAYFDAPSLQPVYDVAAAGDSLMLDGQGGYYEQLNAPGHGDRELRATLLRSHIDRDYRGLSPTRRVDDFRWEEPLPGLDVDAYDTRFRTNQWSMRDDEYALTPPAGTLRIALMGSSQVMGWGVEKDRTFESLLEGRLNAEAGRLGAARVEVLNFAFNGVSLMGYLSALDAQVDRFQPHIVIFVVHDIDLDTWIPRDLVGALGRGWTLPGEALARVLENARLTARTPLPIAEDRLRPFRPKVLGGIYTALGERTAAMGALPVVVPMPIPRKLPLTSHVVSAMETLGAAAEDSDLIALDLTSVFDDVVSDDLMLVTDHDWAHMNAEAHALIADELFRQLMTDGRINLSDQARALANGAHKRSGHLEQEQ